MVCLSFSSTLGSRCAVAAVTSWVSVVSCQEKWKAAVWFEKTNRLRLYPMSQGGM